MANCPQINPTSSSNRGNVMQIINQKTKDMLVNRLKRDEMTKTLFEKRLKLYDLNILIEAEHIKMSDLKIAMYDKMNEVCRLYKKNRKNNVKIELEHKKITEMKLEIVKQLIPLDNDNLTKVFDINREVKIGRLSDDMNYNTPDSWDENRERYETERKKIMNEIHVGERTVAAFEPAGQECMKKLTELIARKNKLEAEIVELTEKILPLNDLISDEPEHHPITFMKVAETDGTNPEDILRNLSD